MYYWHVNNSTISIKRRGEVIDSSTGYRSQGTQQVILQDQPCIFVITNAARQTFSSGIRELTKPTPSVVVDDVLDDEILSGDQAEITWTSGKKTFCRTFTVDSAELKTGMILSRWYLTLSRIKTP